jgi:bla regulator protein blaR1
MLSWMLYVIAVTVLVGLAGLAAERSARLRRASTRWIWALAIVLSLLIPTVIASVSVQWPNVFTPSVSQKIVALREVTSKQLSPLVWMGASAQRAAEWRALDPLLQRAWLAVSLAMTTGLLLSGAHLLWRRRQWREGNLGGIAVYLTPNVGPAVVGLLRPRIVIPSWLISSPEEQQAAVIAHERSHLEAGDPRLLTGALFLLVFMPWNFPLWWQLRRLRYAIEVDCDRRVLRSGQDARRYGDTLIAVGERQSTYLGAVAAMSESKSFLEERITIMISKPSKWWQASAAALACLSVALIGMAAQVSPPNASLGSVTHQEIAVATSVLDSYVGSYKLGESAIMTVVREGEHLTVQLTGQAAAPIYAESNTQFFARVVDTQFTFVADAQGQISSLILQQNGQTITLPRVDAAVAQQIAVNTAAKVQGQTPTPGSEAALRRMIASIAAGRPNYEEMSPELAQATKQQLPQLQLGVAGLGAVRSVQFKGVGNMGWDIYEVRQERGSMQWRIALASDGTIAGALVSAGP